MARLVGIDIRKTHVRAALVRTSYRKVKVERLIEVDLAHVASLDEALVAAVLPLTQHSESFAVSMEGESSFIHRIPIPVTAVKQVDEVLPFEIEAQIPVDIDELVYDHRLLPREQGATALVAMTAAARLEAVRERIAHLARIVGREPERVGVGPLPLANLASLSPKLATQGPIAVVDLGGTRTEVVLLSKGEPVMARTLSRGVAGLPESAPALAAEMRQTLVAWLATGGNPIEAIYLVGGGAAAPGAESYLSSELGVPCVAGLPEVELEELTPDIAAELPKYAKAISLALGLASRPHDLDLRRGPLSYQRGYGFLKEKVPLLSGLAAAILISFAFSTWAELRALSRDRETLEKSLATLSAGVLGEKTTDPEEAQSLLERAKKLDEKDPMPKLDAFDVMVELSKAVPMTMTHDIEELDMQREHVKVNGVVGSTSEAQQIATTLKEVKCFKDVKISKITQVVNSDRQKYVLEFEVKCEEDSKAKKKKTTGDAPAEEN